MSKLRNDIEKAWLSRAAAQHLKPGTVAYRTKEIEFFSGAMAAIHAGDLTASADKLSSLVPVAWVINAISDKPIAGAPKSAALVAMEAQLEQAQRAFKQNPTPSLSTVIKRMAGVVRRQQRKENAHA